MIMLGLAMLPEGFLPQFVALCAFVVGLDACDNSKYWPILILFRVMSSQSTPFRVSKKKRCVASTGDFSPPWSWKAFSAIAVIQFRA